MDTVEKINYRGHIATLVDKIPSGFVVWNTMINGEYVPFCKQGSCKRAYDLSDLRVIKMRRKTPAFRHGDISRAWFSRLLLH